jgi:hypothetical protein
MYGVSRVLAHQVPLFASLPFKPSDNTCRSNTQSFVYYPLALLPRPAPPASAHVLLRYLYTSLLFTFSLLSLPRHSSFLPAVSAFFSRWLAHRFARFLAARARRASRAWRMTPAGAAKASPDAEAVVLLLCVRYLKRVTLVTLSSFMVVGCHITVRLLLTKMFVTFPNCTHEIAILALFNKCNLVTVLHHPLLDPRFRI